MSVAKKVRFRQSGGFGGLTMGADLNTNDLPKRQRERLDVLLQQLGPSHIQRSKEAVRDATTYEITIDDEHDPPRTITFDDASMSEELAHLLKFFSKYAKTVPPR